MRHTRMYTHNPTRRMCVWVYVCVCVSLDVCACFCPQKHTHRLRTAALVRWRLLRIAPVDHNAFRILGGLATGRLVQDRFGQIAEGALDVHVCLGRCFHETNVVFACDLRSRWNQNSCFILCDCIAMGVACFSYRFASILVDDTLVGHVAFVAQYHLFDVLVGVLNAKQSECKY